MEVRGSAGVRAWGRLLRLSLAPSAAADVVAGAVWAQGGYHPTGLGLWTLVLASLCVYHGGMALNDWADREHDARTRGDRPIASGAIAARAALVAALLLLVSGVFLAWRADAGAGAWMTAVAACAIVYDLAGRGPVLGPALLALCRAGNLGAGILLGLAQGTTHADTWVELQPVVFLPALLYGLYVFCVSRVGRMEDAEEAKLAPGPWILAALAVLLAVPWAPHAGPPAHYGFLTEDWTAHRPRPALACRALAAGLVVAAAWAPLRLALAPTVWTTALVERVMGVLLRRLLVFTAALALAAGSLDGLIAAGAILCGYPLSFALRRVFPPS